MEPHDDADPPTPEMMEMYRLHRCLGVPQTKIASQFGITQPTVSKHISKAEAWLRIQYRDQITLFRTRSTARWEHVFTEAVQAWEASKAPDVVKTTRSEKGVEVTTVRETAQVGNPAFLRAASDALQQIDDLWADEIETTERDGGEVRFAGIGFRQQIELQIKILQERRMSLLARGL